MGEPIGTWVESAAVSMLDGQQSKIARKEMEKTVEAFRHELSPRAHRPRVNRAGRKSPSQLLRRQDAAAPTRRAGGARAAPDRDHAVRQGRDARNRKSDPDFRPRPDPDERRQDHPHSDSRADRGAAQGPGQARAQDRRGVPRRRAQPSPRRQRHAQGTAQGQADRPRTSCAPARPRCSRITTEFIEKIDKVLAAKEAEIMEV